MCHESDVAPNLDRIANQVMAMDPTFSRRWPKRRRNHAQEGALAAAVMSNNPNNFARFELQGDPAQCPPSSKSAGNALKREC